MAVLQRNTSTPTSTRKGAGIRNMGRAWLDVAASPLEGIIGTDITNFEYEGSNADKWDKFSQIGSSIGNKVGSVGLGIATGGMSNLAATGVNAGVSGIQDTIPPPPMNTTGAYIAKYGGKRFKAIENPAMQWKNGGLLTEYQGFTHDQGGIPISENDEVEDKENSFDMKDGSKYIFSNSINMPDKKYTFAKGAKRIANKYKLRDGDAMAKTAQQRELEQLSQKQEFVKEVMKTPAQRMQEAIEQQMLKYGGNIIPSTNDDYIPMQNSYDEGGYLNTMFAGGGYYDNPLTKNYGVQTPTFPQILANSSPRKEPFVGKVTPQQMMNKSIGDTYSNFNGILAYNDVYHLGKNKRDTISTDSRNIRDVGENTATNNPEDAYLGTPVNITGTSFGQPRPASASPTMTSKGITTKSNPYKTLQKGTTPEYKQSIAEATTKASPSTSEYKPAYGVPMAGYAAQALSNLPAMFAKPNKVKFQRVRPETIDLSSQRDEARRNRNLQIAMAQRQASQMDNAGQAGVYANAATSNIMGNYGDAFNQSVMQQNTANVGIKNQAQVQNAETQMREAMVNQQELNSIREGKQQAISNMGQIATMSGKTYTQMDQEKGYINNMDKVYPNYGFIDPETGEFKLHRKTPYKCGGKMKRRIK